MVRILGQEEYDKQLDIMKKVKEQKATKGEFVSIDGDVDSRAKRNVPNWNDQKLHEGFEILCGLKGGKLSGGQK